MFKALCWAQLMTQEKNTPSLQLMGAGHICLHINQECKGNAKWVVQATKIVFKNFTRKCRQKRFSQKSNSWGESLGATQSPTLTNAHLWPHCAVWLHRWAYSWKSTESAKWDDFIINCVQLSLGPKFLPGALHSAWLSHHELMYVQDEHVHSSFLLSKRYLLQRLNPKGVSCSVSKLFFNWNTTYRKASRS